MPLTSNKITTKQVQAEIEAIEVGSRKRLRYLRALLRCLEDEEDGRPAEGQESTADEEE